MQKETYKHTYTNWLQPTKCRKLDTHRWRKNFRCLSQLIFQSVTLQCISSTGGPGCLEEQMAAELGQTGEKRKVWPPRKCW